MENMMIYDAVRSVPQNAQKAIGAGRLKGMTDINPMWRIQTLTEQFGPCGFGWTVEITDKRVIDGADGVQVAVVDAALRIKLGGEWSQPIYGTGGSAFTAKEKNGLYTSDEAFKMAYTDAISVCCKMLGFGADIYWQAGRDKYTTTQPQEIICECCGKPVTAVRRSGEVFAPETIVSRSKAKYGKAMCWACSKDAAKREMEDEPVSGVQPWEEV